MFLDNIIPSADLLDYIRKYTIVDVLFPSAVPVPFKAYPPHPQHCLQFYPRDTETFSFNNGANNYCGKRIVVTGQHTRVSNRYIGRDFLTLQVVFQPGALYRLTGIPASELNNTYLDADLIMGAEVNLVNEQLFYAKSHRQMIEIVEQYLRKLIRLSRKAAHPLDAVAGSMLLFAGEYPVLDWFAREACLSARQFNRKFIERMGVNPKLFMRIVRFWSAYKMKNRFPEKDWLAIALHTGYCDYQHLVKEYKDFTEMTPVAFTELECKSPERCFGDAEV